MILKPKHFVSHLLSIFCLTCAIQQALLAQERFGEKVIILFGESPGANIQRKDYFLDFSHSAALIFDLQQQGFLEVSEDIVTATGNSGEIEDQVLAKAFEFLERKSGNSLEYFIFNLSVANSYLDLQLDLMTREGWLKERKKKVLFIPIRTFHEVQDKVLVDFFAIPNEQKVLYEAINQYASLDVDLETSFNEEQRQLMELYLHTLKVCSRNLAAN